MVWVCEKADNKEKTSLHISLSLQEVSTGRLMQKMMDHAHYIQVGADFTQHYADEVDESWPSPGSGLGSPWAIPGNSEL